MSSKSTTRTVLALIPYLNCEPFYEGITELDCEIVWEPPRQLGKLAERGVAACGPMAVADLFRLRDRFEPLGDFGISCEGASHSVLFFSKRPAASLDGARIGLTAQSSTSVRLLRLVLEKKLGISGVRYERGVADGQDGVLLIGDEALRAASDGLDDHPFVIDLGEEWHGWQGLPFVFARWAVSRNLPPADRKRIADSIAGSLDRWEARVPEITGRRGAELGLGEDGIREYLSTFGYRLGPVEGLGEQTFEGLLKELS